MPVQQSVNETSPKNKVVLTPERAIPAVSKSVQQVTPSVQIDASNRNNIAWPENLPGQPPVNTIISIEPDTAKLQSDSIVTPQIDVWQRIRNGYAMREQDSKLIGRFENWYAARPEYMERMTERARRYLFFIVEEVEKRGMPTEIALLPMIESAFNPGADSVAKASGIWQFIPSTGKNFGMQQNWWYDGRRDVISATKGALDYLQKLHDQFGEWDLALAAYNAGENAVMRSQARNRKRGLPTNYSSLRLPKETQQYVPKLMAVKNLIAYPDSFKLKLTDVPNKPYFAEVSTSLHIDVVLAAELAGISMEEFIALNPAHSRPVILKKNNEVLLLPIDSVETFRANLEKANQPLVSWQACPTNKGEQLDSLADRYGITIDKLRSVNGIHRSVKISNGQTLLVPLNGKSPENEFTAFNTNLPPTDMRLLNAVRHTVRKGDTLSGIARRYHVKLSSLKSWNRGVKILRPGQHIMVAQPSSSRASKPNRNIRKVSNSRRAQNKPENM